MPQFHCWEANVRAKARTLHSEGTSMARTYGLKPIAFTAKAFTLHEADQRLNRRLLPSTQTELRAMAAAAIQGLSKTWNAG